MAWFVVHTHPNAEEKAAGHLRRQGFEVFLPRYRSRRRHARRVDTVLRALFPRYLFVRLDLAADRWRPILSTVGVSSMVMNGERPAPVPVAVMDSLFARRDEAGLVLVDDRPVYEAGQKVRLLDGAFADFVGWIQRVPEGDRVAVLLELMGRKAHVMIDAERLESAA